MDQKQLGLLAGLCIVAATLIIISVVACWKVVERERPVPKIADAEQPLDPPVKRVRFAPTVEVLMAPMYRSPVNSRQIEIILPPRPATGLAGEIEPVSRRISTKVFFSLLAGTLCIFIVAVLCWKLGRFIRAFSRDKVLRGGKPAAVQYAKTWHGWTDLTKHKARRQRRKAAFEGFRKRMSWKSTHADYNWVYWDPGDCEIRQHYEDQRGIRWLPRWLLSYEFKTAGVTQDDGSPVDREQQNADKAAVRRGKQKEERVSQKDYPMSTCSGRRTAWEADTEANNTTLRRRRPSSSRLSLPPDDTAAKWTSYRASRNRNPKGVPIYSQRRVTVAGIGKVQPSASHSPSSELNSRRRSSSMPSLSSDSHDQSFATILSHPLSAADESREPQAIRSPLLSRDSLVSVYRTPAGSGSIETSANEPPPNGKSLSWKYKAWGARMQLDTFDQTRFRGYAGRPGSPTSEILKKILSSDQGTEMSGDISAIWRARYHTSTSASTRDIGPSSIPQQDGTAGAEPRSTNIDLAAAPSVSNLDRVAAGSYTLPFPGTPSATSLNAPPNTDHVRTDPSSPQHRADCPAPSESLGCSCQRETCNCAHIPQKAGPSKPKRLPPRRRLSSPEVRLIFNLRRKLEWLSNEFDPGRKPFHFLMLANHWLNRKTWFVLDPVSRVPESNKRQHGDPRVMRSAPNFTVQPRKQKYPNLPRERADTPRIHSWRVSVNRARKSSGMREFLKSIQLFDGSADEPPEGMIDTASWVLRRPPQGFEMSTKQKTCHYNSGTGWHETLSDWQKVERAYRVRKLIHEGRANRTRIKEIANGVGGACQRVARRVTPDWHVYRQGRSGCGSIPSRREKTGTSPRPGAPCLLPQTAPSAMTSGLDEVSQTTSMSPYPTPIDPGGGARRADAGPEIASFQHQEQRDTG